jgi:predicted RecB family nuclease
LIAPELAWKGRPLHVVEARLDGREREDGGEDVAEVAGHQGRVGAAADEAQRKAIEKELLTYNEEDCVAMRHVFHWASRLA